MHEPRLTRLTRAGCAYWTDEALTSRSGVVVAFSERGGGISEPPFASLNLGSHVGDDPTAVDENRAILLSALGLPGLRGRLTTAEQVHGHGVALVDGTDAGSGAWAHRGRPPVAGTDALVTLETEMPLLLMFADCVPVVLVSLTRAVPGVAVVHAGWRGALAGIPAAAARALALATGGSCDTMLAYVGPHICAEHYEVDGDLMSRFAGRFVTVSRARSGGLDLAAAVLENLAEAGVPMGGQCCLDACTAEQTDRFYSYRAEGLTGRHGAVAAILSGRS